MQHGRKGFERLVWACKNVLNHAITWLFYDPDFQSPGMGTYETSAPPDNLLKPHHPLHQTTTPKILVLKDVVIPPFTSGISAERVSVPSSLQHNKIDLTTSLLETHEYLSLLSLASPRVSATDAMNPLLSRYQPPTDVEHAKKGKVVILRWESGFLMSNWVRRAFVEIVKATRKENGWMAIGAWPFEGTGRGKDGYMILQTAEEEESGLRGHADMEIRRQPTMVEGQAEEIVDCARNEQVNGMEESAKPQQKAVSGEGARKKRKKGEQQGRAFVLWEYDRGGLGLGM